ncbi:endonuclease [Salegentibacter salinarum]|uniref:Endonuclease n=1 Tax=Salegentibacter salinarum TaxID=447422 RepID=A0A2N0TSE9_9FLAO|nr:very short patch repair endonuclease [Salegentibacter salinarum]PKD17663.1 endonuclease [Salegentibacter salinarum]SKB50631.1 T/G mismatch-specific endonuclease [Salegentibacter salinarum]
MADVHNKSTRSYNMSRIKGKNTSPEMIVRKYLHSQGFRFRLHVNKLPGKPDIVLPKHKTIIDIRGCFWHKHENCKYGKTVKTSSEVITSRRNSAVDRDQSNFIKWQEMGWTIIVVWSDCELEPRKKNSEKRKLILKQIKEALKN